MKIEITQNGVFDLYVKAYGRLDLDSAVEYGTRIKDAIYDAEESIKEITLDCSAITFISSFGLKVILELYKEMHSQNGTLKLKGVSEQIRNSFNMVGFDRFLLFE